MAILLLPELLAITSWSEMYRRRLIRDLIRTERDGRALSKPAGFEVGV